MRSSVLRVGLLLITCSCASEAPPAAPSSPPASDVEAFRKLGIDAPSTVRVDQRATAPLDLRKIAEAFAEPTTKTAEEVQAEHAIAGNTVSGDVFDRDGDGVTDDAPLAEPPPEPLMERPPAATGGEADSTTRAYEQQAIEAKPAEPEKAADKSKEKAGAKDGRLDGGKKTPATVLAKVAHKKTAARILIETEAGMKALVPRAIRTTVRIQGARARTVIDYVFENPHDRRLEGTFFQPLPADASPAGFSMFDGTARIESEAFFRSRTLLPPAGVTAKPKSGKGSIEWGAPKEARVVAQQRARQVYEDIVRKNVDPGLMELGGSGDFEARVFPLEPKSLKRVVIAYEQTLAFDGSAFQYGFVMPEETSIVERSAEVSADSMQGELTGPTSATLDRSSRWWRWSLDRVPAGAEITASVKPPVPQVVLRGRDKGGIEGDAFFATARPAIPEVGDRTTGRAILMIDSSLSSDEDGAYRRRAALLRALLERDSSIEQYAVMLFDVRPRWLTTIGWIDNTAENRRATSEDLERVFLEGATNFAGALQELTKQRAWAVDGQKTTVFLMSDGHITWGLDRPEAIPQRYPIVRDVRFVTYQFGEESTERSLFDLLSRESGGQTVSMLSEAELEQAAVAHRRAPAELLSVEVKGARAADVAVAGDPKLLFPGQTLSIGGRLLDPNAATLVIRHSSGTLEIPLGDGSRDDEFAPRAFAELHARRLIALDDPRLDRMVVALSQRYRLANARASFLVLDNEAQVEQYRIADEKLDLSNLLALREKERDARTRDLIGLSLEGVSKTGNQVLEILRRRADGLEPAMLPQPLLDAPFAGGRDRATAEVEYRERRNQEKMDYLLYEKIARTRALTGDTFGAVRALSSAIELRPRHGESMRLVGYSLLALAQYEVAVELFERLRLLRSFEGEAYLEEALALDSAGRVDRAAENYEILLAREWARHDGELTTTAKMHYGRLLRSVLARAPLSNEEKRTVRARLAELDAQPADFSLTTHWSSDQVDIDLWVYEPGGEKCFYQYRTTRAGGELFWDTTDGLGPELYRAKSAQRGSYDSMVHYYGSSAPRLSVPAALLVVVDRKDHERSFLMRLLPERDVLVMLRTDVFE
jgi:tetratricopeptide (TPR) repeat protein